jgi:Regulator of chromosome condensation (RCC1) repeat
MNSLTHINLGTGRSIKQIAAGYTHTCAILDNDSLKCWGLNDKGQLGLGDIASRGDSTSEMGDNLPAVYTNLTTPLMTTLGYYNSCVIGSMIDPPHTRQAKCWGDNFSGQLGIGNSPLAVGDSGNEMGTFLTPFSFPLNP